MEGIAKPGGIVMSYETWAHVRKMVAAIPLEPTTFKGIPRQLVPYEVVEAESKASPFALEINERASVVNININMAAFDDASRSAARAALQRALDGFDTPSPKPNGT